MKKIALCLTATCLSLTFNPFQSSASTNKLASMEVVSKSSEAARANSLLLRLNEINVMDKSNLKPSEKKNLRVEVLSIKHQLSEIGGGVYISVGALIIILILLIILL